MSAHAFSAWCVGGGGRDAAGCRYEKLVRKAKNSRLEFLLNQVRARWWLAVRRAFGPP